jgi:uncharacterized membrane protein (DUF4010 family)
MQELPEDLVEFGVALGIGLMLGVERERSKGAGPDRAAAGVRTFMLFSLLGAVADWIGGAGLIVAGVFVSLLVFASYRRSQATNPGLTSEVAMLVTFFLGVLAMRSTVLAAALGVIVAMVLASKSSLHRFVTEALSEQELHDVLLLLAAAFVVMPLLPDEPVDPWSAINPRKLWLLVVAVMAVSTAGYVALRAFGARFGLVLAGLAGGFVSSIATIAAMGDRAKAAPTHVAAFASAGLASNVATMVQMTIIIGTLAPSLLIQAAWPLAAAGAVALIAALVAGLRAFSSPVQEQDVIGKRPFDPENVLGFVAIVATIMLLAAIVRDRLGEASLPWVLAVSGMVDVHAASASAAQSAASGQVQSQTALLAILAALTTNSLMKCLVAAIKGGKSYALIVAPGIVMMVVAFATAMLLTSGIAVPN